MLIRIFMRAEAVPNSSPKRYRLLMRDEKHSGNSDNFETEVNGRDKVKWLLEKKDSMIKSLTEIRSTQDTSKVFKKNPTRNFFFRQEFDVEIVEFSEEHQVKYDIEFITDDGTKEIIDPYIRIKPPRG